MIGRGDSGPAHDTHRCVGSGAAGSRRGAKWLQRGPLKSAALISASTFVAVLGAAVLLQLETQSFGQYLHNLV